MAPRRRASAGTSGGTSLRREAVHAVVEPVITGAGYDLEELTVSRAGRRHVVRVIVDGDAMGLDAIAEVSRAVSAALDKAEAGGGELIAGEYQLEVSSPGVDRPLTLPRHWRRNIGRLVRVRVSGHQVTDRILEASPTGVVLAGVDGEIPYGDLGPGRVQVEFNRVGEEELAGRDLDEIDGVDDDGHDGFGTEEDGQR
jgi:ribosome maturation factor RimP